MKVRAFWLACASIAVLTSTLADDVRVPGTSASFKSVIRQQIGDEKFDMILTGTAIRQKKVIVNFNVYAIASYVDKNAKVDPNQLSLADVVKQLQLVLEREVSGPEIAENFRRMIEVNHGNSFDKEVNVLVQYVSKNPVKKGDGVRFTHIPRVGLHCDIVGKETFLIKNPKFSQAVWDIYFGPTNLGANIKRGLTERL